MQHCCNQTPEKPRQAIFLFFYSNISVNFLEFNHILGGIDYDSLIDQLYVGTLDVDRVNIKFEHIRDRSILNRFSIDYIKHLIFNEEMVDYDLSSEKYKNGYELLYEAPDTKEYGLIKICVQIFNNCINVMTVYPPNYSCSKRRQNSTKSSKRLKEEKMSWNSIRNRHY